MGKRELLSIGEMAKFTGVGIQALRYYERKGILGPVFTDPDSGYRYYSFEQANSIDVISACVELGIPLKELIDLFDTEDTALLQKFFLRNKEAAEQKRTAINTMIALADKALSRMETNKPYALGQIYERAFPEKIYYVKPCGQSLEGANRTRLLVEFAEETKSSLLKLPNIKAMSESLVLMEYGFLCKYTGEATEYFTFAEVPSCLKGEKTITIPPNSYHFRKARTSAIENAPGIFKEYTGNAGNYMVVEVEEVISGKSKINEPIYELRLVI